MINNYILKICLNNWKINIQRTIVFFWQQLALMQSPAPLLKWRSLAIDSGVNSPDLMWSAGGSLAYYIASKIVNKSLLLPYEQAAITLLSFIK